MSLLNPPLALRVASASPRPHSPVQILPTAALPNSLDACHELIRRLGEENTHLRQAGSFFGQLAERLSEELGLHQTANRG
jgi:hypothetical protein